MSINKVSESESVPVTLLTERQKQISRIIDTFSFPVASS